MIRIKKHWHIRLQTGKTYHCRHIEINLGLCIITISFIFLGLKKFDIRVNFHSCNW